MVKLKQIIIIITKTFSFIPKDMCNKVVCVLKIASFKLNKLRNLIIKVV